MSNSSESVQVKFPTPQINRGPWSERDNAILLATNSNHIAAILLGRTRAACAGHRSELVNEGRKSVPMVRIRTDKAKQIAIQLLLKQNQNHQNGQGQNQLPAPKVTEQKQPQNTVDRVPAVVLPVQQPAQSQQLQLPQEMEGFSIMVNDNEMFFRKAPKRLVITGQNVKFSVE